MPSGRVGRYVLEEVIGVGSFATVHRARDERLESTVVVKILAENHSLNPEIRERFIAEGRSLRRVSSPHVVAVHDIGENERQQPYLVLEHADRGTLGDRVEELRREGWTASPADIVLLAEQLAAALEAVHDARLVHRDLSPANVLISTPPAPRGGDVGSPTLLRPDERVLVADLGMCKDLAVSSGLTVAGGTSGFRSPEMDGGPAIIDIRADLWSLSSLVTWVAEGADLPDELTTALGRSLAIEPADRHADVAAWLDEVEAAVSPPRPDPQANEATGGDDADRGPTAAGDDVATPTERTASRSRPPWPTALRRLWPALLVALLLGLLSGWLVRGSGVPPAATQTARIQIEGPEQVTVGEPATFTLRHLGTTSWVWVLPTGEHVVDQESFTLTPSSPGRATIVVRSRDDAGRDLQDTYSFEVSD